MIKGNGRSRRNSAFGNIHSHIEVYIYLYIKQKIVIKFRKITSYTPEKLTAFWLNQQNMKKKTKFYFVLFLSPLFLFYLFLFCGITAITMNNDYVFFVFFFLLLFLFFNEKIYTFCTPFFKISLIKINEILFLF